MTRRAVVATTLAIAGLGLAGCGDEPGTGAAGPTPTASAAAGGDARAVADALAERCGLVRPVPGTPMDIVPTALVPPGAYVARGRRSGSAARATVLLPLGLVAALEDIGKRAQPAGYKVAFKENEGVEAEIYLSGPGGLVRFRLFRSAACPDEASQATFERSYTEG